MIGSRWRSLMAFSGSDASLQQESTMPLTPHTERHFTAGEAVRDVVIGMSDGLTVPFALAAGTGRLHRNLCTEQHFM
jgi:hypothetical protein